VNEYTATNGVTVFPLERGMTFRFPDIGQSKWGINQEKVDALREFFRAEEDERLGRWRWPEKPEFIVFPSVAFQHPADSALVQVVNEANGQSRSVRRDDPDRSLYGYFSEAAEAYFDAHPEPKPWHNAKEGDVWEFKLGREHFDIFTGLPYSREMTRLFQRTTGGWRVIGRKNWFLNESEISEARPVWSYPEGDS
jgi:hypothetical protein